MHTIEDLSNILRSLGTQNVRAENVNMESFYLKQNKTLQVTKPEVV